MVSSQERLPVLVSFSRTPAVVEAVLAVVAATSAAVAVVTRTAVGVGQQRVAAVAARSIADSLAVSLEGSAVVLVVQAVRFVQVVPVAQGGQLG